MDANSPEYQQQVIDVEIKSLDESIRELKCRRNAIAPISTLPTEIITIIFSYLHLPSSSHLSSLPTKAVSDLFYSSRLPGTPPPGRLPDDPLSWLHPAHVCHRWREIALNHPPFWSHVDFTNLTSAGATETLARAKNSPLYLEAGISIDRWDDARIDAFKRELQTRVSQICYLDIHAESFHLLRVLEGLASPAPNLEHLSLSQPDMPSGGVPHILFGGSAPRLSSLKLCGFDIGWDSPLLKGLRYLEIREPPPIAWPDSLEWLNALREMPQLEKLVIHSSFLTDNPYKFTSNIQCSVSLPSLTHMDISAPAGNCAIALSFLSLPALTRLCVTLHSRLLFGSDIQDLFRYLSRHTHGPQDTEPLQSVLISSDRTRATILAWSEPDINVNVHDPFALLSMALSARIALSITSSYPRRRNCLHDRAIESLTLESIVTLTAQHRSRLDEGFWLRHAPKWSLLRCVRLAPPEARGFIEMLLQDRGGREDPVLPSLTELVLIDVEFSASRTDRLCDALMKRAEQGVPLETLDLRKCHATDFAVMLLCEIVVYVWGPAEALKIGGFRCSWDAATGGSFIIDEDRSDDSNSSDEDMAWVPEVTGLHMEED